MPLYLFLAIQLYLLSLLRYITNNLPAIQNFIDSYAYIKDLTAYQFFDSFVFV